MKNFSSVAQKLFIFDGLTKEELDTILDSVPIEIKDYCKGDTVYSCNEFEHKIGFVLEGRCSVRRPKPDGSAVTLNTLEPYDSFGVTAAFSNEKHFPTEICAMKKSKLMFISKSDAVMLVQTNGTVAMNVIGFLVNRIGFLNEKIATFTNVKAENKLAMHIIAIRSSAHSDVFSFNCKKAAEELNLGRASVYRALEALCQAGYINYSENKIYINDPLGLERISK